MSYYFSVCSTFRYQEIYIDFLLQHYEQLNLPYSFQTSLSYIASPILMDKDGILIWNADDELSGAIGFIHGTGERDYQDKHIIQVQTVFLRESCRNGRTFLRSMQYLAQYIAQLQSPVSELRFWIPAQPTLQKLCSQWAQKNNQHESEYGILEEYRLDFAEWHDAMMKYPYELYF